MPRALASSQGHHHAIVQDPNRQNIPPNGGSPYCLFSQSVSFVLSFITDASSHTESPTNPLHTTPPDSIPFHHPHHAPHTTHHAPHTTHHSPITRHRTQNTTHHTPPSPAPPPTPITRLHTTRSTHQTPHTTPPCTARHTHHPPPSPDSTLDTLHTTHHTPHTTHHTPRHHVPPDTFGGTLLSTSSASRRLMREGALLGVVEGGGRRTAPAGTLPGATTRPLRVAHRSYHRSLQPACQSVTRQYQQCSGGKAL